jgi:hypothetical protein
LTGLDLSVLQIKTKIVRWHTADSKPVKQEVNCTVIRPPLSIPWLGVQIQPPPMSLDESEIEGKRMHITIFSLCLW